MRCQVTVVGLALLALLVWRVLYSPPSPAPLGSPERVKIATSSKESVFVHRVAGNAFGTYSYLYADAVTMEAAIVDASGHAEAILAEAQQRGYKITQLLQTHGHLDHIQALPDYKRLLSPVAPTPVMHSADDRQYRLHGVPIPLWGPLRIAPLDWLAATCVAYLLGMTREPMPTYEAIKHGDIIRVGSISIQVIHLPGHSPGSVAFYDKSNRIAFTGDVLMKGVIGRTDLAESSSAQMAASLNSLLQLLPDDDTILLSGHTLETTMAQEKQSNRFLDPNMLERLTKEDL